MKTKSKQEKHFEERLGEQLNKSDFSEKSPYELMRKYLVKVLSSRQLYQEVAKRKEGLHLFVENNNPGYFNYFINYNLGLATSSQIEKALHSNYKVLKENIEKSMSKIIMPRKNDLALVETEYGSHRFQSDEYGNILQVLAPSTLSNSRVANLVIKDILSTFRINPRTLEKRIFEAIKDADTEGIFY